MLRFTGLLLVLALGLGTIVGCGRARSSESARQQAREILAEATTFPFDFSLPDLDGKTVSSKDFAGKLLIVDFWGTWCPPCRMEVPHFVALHEKYNARGLEIVGINYERGQDAAAKVALIRKFADSERIPYSCLIGDEVTQDKVPNLDGFPTTLIIDRTGKVRAKLEGYHDLETLDAIVSLLLDDTPAELR